MNDLKKAIAIKQQELATLLSAQKIISGGEDINKDSSINVPRASMPAQSNLNVYPMQHACSIALMYLIYAYPAEVHKSQMIDILKQKDINIDVKDVMQSLFNDGLAEYGQFTVTANINTTYILKLVPAEYKYLSFNEYGDAKDFLWKYIIDTLEHNKSPLSRLYLKQHLPFKFISVDLECVFNDVIGELCRRNVITRNVDKEHSSKHDSYFNYTLNGSKNVLREEPLNTMKFNSVIDVILYAISKHDLIGAPLTSQEILKLVKGIQYGIAIRTIEKSVTITRSIKAHVNSASTSNKKFGCRHLSGGEVEYTMLGQY